VVTAAGLITAKVVKVDKALDLALLKAEGIFMALPVIPSRGVRLGVTAATVGLAENVNYALKSSFLLGFLESVPEVAAKLREPNTQQRKFEDVVKSVEQATVLVLVY